MLEQQTLHSENRVWVSLGPTLMSKINSPKKKKKKDVKERERVKWKKRRVQVVKESSGKISKMFKIIQDCSEMLRNVQDYIRTAGNDIWNIYIQYTVSKIIY